MALYYISRFPYIRFILAFTTGNHLHFKTEELRIFFFKIKYLADELFHCLLVFPLYEHSAVCTI